MPARNGSVHIATTTRAYKDKVYRTHLLRRSYREDGKVKNETLGNLSHLPEPLIDIIRRSLQVGTVDLVLVGAGCGGDVNRTVACWHLVSTNMSKKIGRNG